MTYKELREQQQRELNALPIKFAFGRERFAEMMKEWGLTENDTDKIYRLPIVGGYYLRSDADIIREWYNKDDGLDELMKDKAFRLDAFRYEMDNHEYSINMQADYDVCGIFCEAEWDYQKDYIDYLTEAGHEDWIPEYEQARAQHNEAFNY